MPTTAFKYGSVMNSHIVAEEIKFNMDKELYKYFFKILVSLDSLNPFSKMYTPRSLFNFMFRKYNEKYLAMCLKINIFHSMTIKLHCKNLTSIHVAWRGQSPNTRIIIVMCSFLKALSVSSAK